MKKHIALGCLAAAAFAFASPVMAGCGDPNAWGVSRVISVDTSNGIEVGKVNFPQTLPLNDMEVVLTFDDGPLAGTTPAILAALRDACAKATFFAVGTMAKAAPNILRQELADGDTIGTHTYDHVLILNTASFSDGMREIDRGFATITAVLGQPPAPFFRFPGFGMTHALRSRLAEAHIGVFSVDVMGYDWTPISADQVRLNVLHGLLKHRGGIVLLHDIKHTTAHMMPQLLQDLKNNGFKLVHMVPAHPELLVASGPLAAVEAKAVADAKAVHPAAPILPASLPKTAAAALPNGAPAPPATAAAHPAVLTPAPVAPAGMTPLKALLHPANLSGPAQPNAGYAVAPSLRLGTLPPAAQDPGIAN